MWELDHKEGWVPRNWCFWTVVLDKNLESPLDSKEIKPVNPKGNQPWIFIGRTDAEAETPIFWPPDAESWLTGKDPDTGKDRGQEEKGVTEDEMVGWHYQFNGLLEIVKDREVWCVAVHGVAESYTTERLNNNSGRLRRVSKFPCLVPSGSTNLDLGGRCLQLFRAAQSSPACQVPGPFWAGFHSGQCQIHRQGRIFSCLFIQLKESFLSNCRHQVVRKTIAVFLDHFFTSITNAFLFSPEISFHLPIFCKVVDHLTNPSVLHPSLYLQSLSIQDSAYCFMKQSISHFPLNININIIDLSHKSF